MIDKPKAGFQVPLTEWLQKDLRPLVEKHLHVSNLDQDIFIVEEIQSLKESFFAGKQSNANIIWFVLMFQMWQERWF